MKWPGRAKARRGAAHFLDLRAPLSPTDAARLRAEKRTNLVDFVVRHANLRQTANRGARFSNGARSG
jgi:hypothetical protein